MVCTVKVSYFDVAKYQEEWKQYYIDEKTIHSNRLMNPTEKGWSYLRDVEVESNKFKIYDIDDRSLFSYVVETDDDYLYKLTGEPIFMSHLHTFKVANYYYEKYNNPNIINLNEGIFKQFERDLKIKKIIE